jgi:acyl dehydratase
VRVEITTSDGAPLVEHLWSSFYVQGKVAAPFGPDLPDHHLTEEARARPLGRKTLFVDRDQAFRYAGVSGDRVGHAIDDEIAQQQGFPGKILQGMCTLSLCSGALVDMTAAGEPARLRRLACRFARPTRPNKELHVDIYDAGRSRDGGQAYAFEATQNGATVIKHGAVEVGSVAP